MKLASEEVEVVPLPPAATAKLTLVAILAALLGVSLTLLVAGVWLHYQQRAAWLAQVQTLSETVRQNDVALAELRAQNATLAKHLKLLKEYSIARSTSERAAAAADAARSTPSAPSVNSANAMSSVNSVNSAGDAAAGAPSAAPRASATGKARKAKAPDCELAGKTPEQQAATLRRCVQQYETPAAKARQ